jgi:hypothetical protein
VGFQCSSRARAENKKPNWLETSTASQPTTSHSASRIPITEELNAFVGESGTAISNVMMRYLPAITTERKKIEFTHLLYTELQYHRETELVGEPGVNEAPSKIIFRSHLSYIARSCTIGKIGQIGRLKMGMSIWTLGLCVGILTEGLGWILGVSLSGRLEILGD